MYISLYSGPRKWALTRSVRKPPYFAEANCGNLTFEGMVPIGVPMDLLPPDIWDRLDGEIERHAFAEISEDLGITLIEECVCRYGQLLPRA